MILWQMNPKWDLCFSWCYKQLIGPGCNGYKELDKQFCPHRIHILVEQMTVQYNFKAGVIL